MPVALLALRRLRRAIHGGAAACLLASTACGSTSRAGAPGPDAGGEPPESGAKVVEGGAAAEGGSVVLADAGLRADASDGGAAPTASSWLGTNVSADLPRVDVTYQLTPFTASSGALDANGYPGAGGAGTSQTDIGYILPSGMYDVSYRGTGTLGIAGIGALVGGWQSVSGENRGVLQITGTPGAFGNFLTLTIQNGANQTVTDVHILFPGFDYDTTSVFLPQFVALLTPFRALRFMDWESTNNSTLAAWADRPQAAHFGASPNGEPYEHLVELVNETGKDAWVTVPEHATDDFIAQFAAFLAQNLDFARIQSARDAAGLSTPFQVIVENSNETWNQGFSAYATFLAAAQASPTRYSATYAGSYGPSWQAQSGDLMTVGQYEADRLVSIGTAFRAAFSAAGHASAVAPVLSGWATGPAYSDDGLTFIQSHYGAPKNYVAYIAIAPYFGPEPDAGTATLPDLFSTLDDDIAGMDGTFQDFAKLSAQYGIPMAAYEGGQSLTGTTDQPILHLAQHDARMYAAYTQYFALWNKDFGRSLFMHFSLAGDPGLPENIYQYGYWGSIIGVLEDPSVCEPNLPTLVGTETIASVVHHCPKYRALAEQVP
jgi:hypothetical protein